MEPGELIGERFEIECESGRGGMGVVYRARDRSAGGAPVAVKILHGGAAHEAERFAREVRALAELRHPGIVRYVAHGATTNGQLYLAMEWLDGEELSTRLQRGSLSVTEGAAVVGRVAEALAVAHRRGIVHRDIKPGNVFLCDARLDRIKLLDFGIARLGDQVTAVTTAGSVIGTPAFMSPEQARGAESIDARSDVFSLACLLFKCLTGATPFAGDDVRAVLVKILFEEAPRLADRRWDVPEGLDVLAAQMLAKSPYDRPEDGAAVAAAIASLGALDIGGRISLTPMPGLTAVEQRLLSVVLTASPALAVRADMARTQTGSGKNDEIAALRSAARAYGGRFERLADGSAVVTMSGDGAASDQAARAARCALALRNITPGARIVLATGRGQVRGTTAFGEVIDRAANMLRAATNPVGSGDADTTPPGILLDEATAGLLDVRFVVAGDRVAPELLGERAFADESRKLLGRPSPCVGRDRQLALLAGLYDECVGEPVARAILVKGSAGVGKSRLRHEFIRAIRARGDAVEVWIGRGDPMSDASPFGIVGDSIRRAIGLHEGAPLAERAGKLRARVSRFVPANDVDRVTAFLGELLGGMLPSGASDAVEAALHSARQDPMLMGDQISRAWVDWLTAETSAQPVVIVLEDLHWGDVPSARLINAALRDLRDRRFMVVAFSRPEIEPGIRDLWDERGADEILLEALPRTACATLVRAMLGDSATSEMVDRVVSHSGGNAFFLEELIRAAAEGNDSVLPETVLAMTQSRLERLDGPARRVLRAASVFGQVFWVDGVRALLGGDRQAGQLGEWLAELVEREIVSPRPTRKFPGHEEFTFRHAIPRAAAYSMLTESDRTLGHRLAGEWLEQAGETDTAMLAEHFERGGDSGRAVPCFRRAAEQALNGNDLAAALNSATRGIAAGATGTMFGELRLVQAEAKRWMGEFAVSQQHALEAMNCLATGSAAWCRAATEVASSISRLGHCSDEHIGQLLQITSALGAVTPASTDRSFAVMAVARTAYALFSGGRSDLARSALGEIGRFATGPEDNDPALVGWLARANGLLARVDGDTGGYIESIERAIDSLDALGDRRGACTARSGLGYSCIEMGALERAERVLGESIRMAESIGIPRTAAVARHNLGLALAYRGSLTEAIAVEESAIAALGLTADRRIEGAAHVYLALILTMSGSHERADAELQTGLEMLGVAPALRPYALAALARLRLAQGRAGDALLAAREALRLADLANGAVEGDALVRLVFAEALHASDDLDGARNAIRAARRRLLERGEKIRDAVWRASFLGNVPDNARTMELATRWLAGT